MLEREARPYVIAPGMYDGKVTNTLTYRVGKQSIELRGRAALTTYGDRSSTARTGYILFHGSYKSPDEIGMALVPQQAYSKKADGSLVPHGEPAICFSNVPDFPIVRSLFKEGAPAFIDYPADEMILSTRGDELGNEITIVTKDALARVKDINPTGYVYVVPEFQQGRGRAKAFQGPDKKESEYRITESAIPIFVMPVTLDDLPPTMMVVKDTATGIKIRDSLNRIDPTYYSDLVEDIFGEDYYKHGYI